MVYSIALAVVWLVGLFTIAAAIFVYMDAPDYDLPVRPWLLRTVFLPIFGFVWYYLERREREYNPKEDPDEHFVGGAFKVHKSRADDAPWISSDGDEEKTTETDETERSRE